MRSRKPPEERREEILANASQIALEHGLERITLRAVAERLGVQPGLITHYFPAAEDLVVEAFTRAAVDERIRYFPVSGTPRQRLAQFIAHIESGASAPLARLWLNARHLTRFSPPLGAAVDEQDRLDHDGLAALIVDGIGTGDFADVDVETACTRIYLAVDGFGSYVNSDSEIGGANRTHFVCNVVEWTLSIEPGSLHPAPPRHQPPDVR